MQVKGQSSYREPIHLRIEANISAWLESFYIAINRKAQVFPRPGKGFGVGSKEAN